MAFYQVNLILVFLTSSFSRAFRDSGIWVFIDQMPFLSPNQCVSTLKEILCTESVTDIIISADYYLITTLNLKLYTIVL